MCVCVEKHNSTAQRSTSAKQIRTDEGVLLNSMRDGNMKFEFSSVVTVIRGEPNLILTSRGFRSH